MAIVLWGTATSELSAVVTGPSGPLVSGPRPGRLTAANRISRMPDRGEAQLEMPQNRQGAVTRYPGGRDPGAIIRTRPAGVQTGARRASTAWGSEPRPRVPLPTLQLAF